jgi:hypothetical protein
MKNKPVPKSYWSYRYRVVNGKKRYIKIKKVAGKEKIRVVKKRRR